MPRFMVERVLDGETIEIGGGTRVLYLGLKAPETTPEQCFGQEARERNRALVEGKWIEIARDVSDLDPLYGYLLRYVYVDGQLINELLVREGYARASVQEPNVKLRTLLLSAESEARDQRRGLWAVCSDSP
jgi:micrococcal nuclease